LILLSRSFDALPSSDPLTEPIPHDLDVSQQKKSYFLVAKKKKVPKHNDPSLSFEANDAVCPKKSDWLH
jgi:hypothetical protein